MSKRHVAEYVTNIADSQRTSAVDSFGIQADEIVDIARS